jgi:hypothetical protein
MVFDFGTSAGLVARGRLAAGGEELSGYEIGEDTGGILKVGGEDGNMVSF